MAKGKIDSMIQAVKSALNMDDQNTQLSICLHEIKRDTDENHLRSE